MTYAYLTISQEEEGRQVVRAPRTTDALGHALRGAFDERAGLPDDMVHMLRQLDTMPYRAHRSWRSVAHDREYVDRCP